jgi:surface antigen/streptogramin lyase
MRLLRSRWVIGTVLAIVGLLVGPPWSVSLAAVSRTSAKAGSLREASLANGDRTGFIATVGRDTGGYPWANASPVNLADYDWGYAKCPKSAPYCMTLTMTVKGVRYGLYDPWNYYFRNCTSYVAWKLHSLGVPSSKIAGLGNGGDWATRAANKKLPTGTTPKVGAAAVDVRGNFGHVAYVQSVNAKTGEITVLEYNKGADGWFGWRTGRAAKLGFSKFVYFGRYMADKTAPSAPSGLTTSAIGTSTFKLSWKAASDNVGVAGYYVDRNGHRVATTDKSTLSYTFRGLTCGTSLNVGVAAYDTAKNTSRRAALNARTKPCAPPPPPADAQAPTTPSELNVASITRTQLTLSWAAARDNVGVTGYHMYLNGNAVATTAATSYTFAGLSCSVAYQLAVDAFDAAKNASGRATLTVTTDMCPPPPPPDMTPPSTPGNLTVQSVTTNGFKLSWSASTDNVGVTGYNVYLNGVPVATTAASSYTFAGLSCGVAYQLAVDAFDAAKNTSGQAMLMSATDACPPPPTATLAVDLYPVPGDHSSASAMTLGPDGGLWFVIDQDPNVRRIDPVTHTVTAYPLPNSIGATGIASGPDGALWISNVLPVGGGGDIVRMTTSGATTAYSNGGSLPEDITAGSDGALWAVADYGFVPADGCNCYGAVERITTSGVVTKYKLPTKGILPIYITLGPDGALWFVGFPSSDAASPLAEIGRVTTSGEITEHPLSSGIQPGGITAGPDGNLWFTEFGGIGRITTSGTIASFPVSFQNSTRAIIAGPDGNIWFANFGGVSFGGLGRITPAGVITSFTLTSGGQAVPLYAGEIALGSDHAIWYFSQGRVGRIGLP